MSSPFRQYMIRFQPGERIYAQGERGASMFIVQSGSVRLLREEEGHEAELGVMEKGDFFGEMAILEGGMRGQSAEAVSETELIEINAATFDAMIRRNMEIAVRMLRKLSSRLRGTEEALHGSPAAPSPPRAPRTAPAAGPPAADPAPRPAKAAPAPERPVPAASAAPRAAPAVPTGAAPPAAPGCGGNAEIFLETEDGSATFPLKEEEALIGRYDPVTEIQPEVDLTDLDLKRSVSRRHARIARREGRYYVIEEVGALNGSFVNGRKLITGKPTPLEPGDLLALGMVRLVFRCGQR